MTSFYGIFEPHVSKAEKLFAEKFVDRIPFETCWNSVFHLLRIDSILIATTHGQYRKNRTIYRLHFQQNKFSCTRKIVQQLFVRHRNSQTETIVFDLQQALHHELRQKLQINEVILNCFERFWNWYWCVNKSFITYWLSPELGDKLHTF